MGVLSKPYKFTFQLIASYLGQLYMNPVQTKSITSCVLASLGNGLSQAMTHGKVAHPDSLLAFALFGLLFGGTIPHYFYKIVTGFLSQTSGHPLLQLFLIERLFFMPAYTFFSLYTLNRFEGHNHERSFDRAMAIYPNVVEANLKYLTLLNYINIYFVPPMLRVLVSNLIGFFWVLVMSYKRQKKESRKGD